MSNASRGHALERRARDELRAAGYVVGRVRGSLGPTDLMCLPTYLVAGPALLVQVKGGPRPEFPPDEWNEFFYLARDTNAIPLLATKPGPSRTMTWQQLTAAKTGQRRQPLIPYNLVPLPADETPGGDA